MKQRPSPPNFGNLVLSTLHLGRRRAQLSGEAGQSRRFSNPTDRRRRQPLASLTQPKYVDAYALGHGAPLLLCAPNRLMHLDALVQERDRAIRELEGFGPFDRLAGTSEVSEEQQATIFVKQTQLLHQAAAGHPKGERMGDD